VKFLPLQPIEKLNQLLNSADIHVLPQLAGAADLVMPSKLTGMLASGRPVVACAEQGTQIAQIVENCGLVVSPENAEELSAAIIRLADDENLRIEMGSKARTIALDKWEKVKVLEIFQQELVAFIQ
jgi:colanic acid biosynthesis glycosyl transferase WcaI